MCILVLVGVARAFGPVVHLQRKFEPRIEKNIAKRLLKKFEDLCVVVPQDGDALSLLC